MNESVKQQVLELQAAHVEIREFRERARQHATLDQRVLYIERFIGDSANKHDLHLRQPSIPQSQVSSGVDAQQFTASTLMQRLHNVEQLLGDSSDKHKDEIDS